jgi:hypothetical protein
MTTNQEAETDSAVTPPETGDEPRQPETDWRSETDKWKAQARENEKRAKANARELEQLRQASMSDQEKAVALARLEARRDALREVGASRVDDAIRIAAAGRKNVAIDVLLEGLDRGRFLDDEGQPDVTAVQEWVDRLAPEPEPATGFPDLGQGARGNASTSLGDPLLNALKSKLGVR